MLYLHTHARRRSKWIRVSGSLQLTGFFATPLSFLCGANTPFVLFFLDFLCFPRFPTSPINNAFCRTTAIDPKPLALETLRLCPCTFSIGVPLLATSCPYNHLNPIEPFPFMSPSFLPGTFAAHHLPPPHARPPRLCDPYTTSTFK